MRSRDFIIIVICIFLTVGFLVAAGFQLEPINRQRQEMKLVMDKPENIPPSLAFVAAATGAFRGLVVDVLWIRADRLKEAGQFFDAKQLAEWITILQPRFASVWEFQAWNMAYNISVAIPASQYEQRWRWVKNGYELLRDEAIDKWKLNNIGLYEELARIFQHKIGGISDDAHKYYKLQLALQMSPLLSSVDAQLTDEDTEYFNLLAKAPSKLQDIIKDPNIAELVNALKSADDRFSDESFFVGNYLSLRQNAGRYNSAAGDVIDDFRGTDTLKDFDIFTKAYQLRTVWKLDPNLMCQVNNSYGPIDWDDPNTHLPLNWRHADSHALYWASKGLKIAAQDSTKDISSEEITLDRYITHSLQNLFRFGKMIIFYGEVPVSSDDSSRESETKMEYEVFLRPDLRYFRPYNDAWLKDSEKYNTEEEQNTLETFQNQHRNMLKNALLSFYLSGHLKQAQEILEELRKRYPRPEFNVSLKEFATKRMLEEFESLGIQDVREQITAILKEGYYFYAIRDDDAAAGREANAKEIYNYYKLEYDDGPRTDLPEFNKLKATSAEDFLDDTLYPVSVKQKFLSRLRLDNEQSYNQLIQYLEKKNKESGQMQ